MFSILVMPFVLFASTALHPSVSDSSKEIQARLESRISSYTLAADGFVSALSELAGKFKLPMGVEWVRSSGSVRKVNLSWQNATVRQMLEAVVKSQPGYRLQINDGVVHIFSPDDTSSGENFLDIGIDSFEIKNQVVEIASHKLRDLVRVRVSPPPPASQHPGGLVYSQGASVGEPEVTLTLRSVNVRQVLDALALASDRKVWVVTFTPDGTVTPTRYRRTGTLWNKENVPDPEQPVWDMFRWGDSIP
jgi:hypothetical protein